MGSRITTRLPLLSAAVALGVAAMLVQGRTAAAFTSAPGSKVSFIQVFATPSSGPTWATIALDLPRSSTPSPTPSPPASPPLVAPYCYTPSMPTAFVFRVDTESGKAWLSQLVAAKLSGVSVTINGTGQCPQPALVNVSGLDRYEEVSSVVINP